MDKDSSKIKILNSKPGNEKDIVFILKETWLDTYPSKKFGITKKDILTKDFDSQEKKKAWLNAIKESKKKSNYLFVAEYDNKVVGICMVAKNKKFNELKLVYVLPKYQGLSIGKKLVDEGIKWLGRKKDIIVFAAEYNKNATDFYKKFGFIETGVKHNDRLVNGKIMPEIQLMLSTKVIKK
jgi:GNAT superfamily N-acetyltransferase